jgi:hypothetical protein
MTNDDPTKPEEATYDDRLSPQAVIDDYINMLTIAANGLRRAGVSVQFTYPRSGRRIVAKVTITGSHCQDYCNNNQWRRKACEDGVGECCCSPPTQGVTGEIIENCYKIEG